MDGEKVRVHFENRASDYDSFITRLTPKYKEQQEVILDMIPFEYPENLRALDLGAGTGALSRLLLENFSRIQVTAFDVSENMLDICEQNLAEFEQRLQLKAGSFDAEDIGSGYHIVVSGLATHHLPDEQKQVLYCRILRSLVPGGVFLNREIVLGETPYLNRRYQALWRRHMRACGEDDKEWFAKHLEMDKPAKVEDQLSWLRQAGFVDVGCHWRYYNFAVFGGRKPDN